MYFCKSQRSNRKTTALNAFEAMKKYVDRARVVAIGEIGYNLINDLKKELFLKQRI